MLKLSVQEKKSSNLGKFPQSQDKIFQDYLFCITNCMNFHFHVTVEIVHFFRPTDRFQLGVYILHVKEYISFSFQNTDGHRIQSVVQGLMLDQSLIIICFPIFRWETRKLCQGCTGRDIHIFEHHRRIIVVHYKLL